MESMCRRAVALGLRQIAFTEHVDYVPVDAGYGFFRPADYLEAVDRCREAFAGRLTVLSGAEIGEFHRYRPSADALLTAHSFDVVIGSLHWVGEDPVFGMAFFRARDVDSAYSSYLVELERMCREGGFDVLGHLDFVKRAGFDVYGQYDVTRYEDLIRQVLSALVENRIALEVNTASLRCPVAQLSPCETVLRWYREAGGELLTFGSDAHDPGNLAAGWDTAIQAARAAGFSRLTTYSERQPQWVTMGFDG